MAYVTGARPTSLDRKRKRQRLIFTCCLIAVIGILIWGILEFATRPTQLSAPTEVNP